METKSQNSFVNSQVKRLAQKYPSLPWDTDLKAEWSRRIAERVERFGVERVDAMVTGFIDHEEYAKPERLDGYLPSGDKPARKFCDMCEKYEGWIHVLVDGEKVSRVMRCQHDGRIHVRVQVGPSGNRMWMDATVYNGPVAPEPKKYERPESKPMAKPVIPSVAELAKEMKKRIGK